MTDSPNTPNAEDAETQVDQENAQELDPRDTNPEVEGFDQYDSDGPTILTPEGELEKLRQELGESQDRVLRAQAELENYRKRALREMEDMSRYSSSGMVFDLLEVVDNLELAIQSAKQTAGDDSQTAGVISGVDMVAQQLHQVLQKHHCERIPGVGSEFDPNLHQAIGQQPSEEHAAGLVSLETRVGYRLYDRVIRPAQVFVSTGPNEAESSEAESSEAEASE